MHITNKARKYPYDTNKMGQLFFKKEKNSKYKKDQNKYIKLLENSINKKKKNEEYFFKSKANNFNKNNMKLICMDKIYNNNINGRMNMTNVIEKTYKKVVNESNKNKVKKDKKQFHKSSSKMKNQGIEGSTMICDSSILNSSKSIQKCNKNKSNDEIRSSSPTNNISSRLLYIDTSEKSNHIKTQEMFNKSFTSSKSYKTSLKSSSLIKSKKRLNSKKNDSTKNSISSNKKLNKKIKEELKKSGKDYKVGPTYKKYNLEQFIKPIHIEKNNTHFMINDQNISSDIKNDSNTKNSPTSSQKLPISSIVLDQPNCNNKVDAENVTIKIESEISESKNSPEEIGNLSRKTHAKSQKLSPKINEDTEQNFCNQNTKQTIKN